MRKPKNSLELILQSDFNTGIKQELCLYLNTLRMYAAARNDRPTDPRYDLRAYNLKILKDHHTKFKTDFSQNLAKILSLATQLRRNENVEFTDIDLDIQPTSTTSTSSSSSSSSEFSANHSFSSPSDSQEKQEKTAEFDTETTSVTQSLSTPIEILCLDIWLYLDSNHAVEEQPILYFDTVVPLIKQYDEMMYSETSHLLSSEEPKIKEINNLIEKKFTDIMKIASTLYQKPIRITYKDTNKSPTFICLAELSNEFQNDLEQLTEESYQEFLNHVGKLAKLFIILKTVLNTKYFTTLNDRIDSGTHQTMRQMVEAFNRVLIQLKPCLLNPHPVVVDSPFDQFFKLTELTRHLVTPVVTTSPLKRVFERNKTLFFKTKTPSTTPTDVTPNATTNTNNDYIGEINRLLENAEKQKEFYLNLKKPQEKAKSIGELESLKNQIQKIRDNRPWGEEQERCFEELIGFIASHKAGPAKSVHMKTLSPSR